MIDGTTSRTALIVTCINWTNEYFKLSQITFDDGDSPITNCITNTYSFSQVPKAIIYLQANHTVLSQRKGVFIYLFFWFSIIYYEI